MLKISSLEQRVIALENRLRLWRNLAVSLSTLVASIVLFGALVAGQTPILNGLSVLGILRQSATGQKESTERMPATKQAKFFNSLQTRSLQIVNDNNGVVCQIGSFSDGDGVLLIFNGNGKELVYLGSSAAGDGLLGVKNSDGKKFAEVGTRGVFVLDGGDNTLVGAGRTADGHGRLVVKDVTGRTRVSAGSDSDANGQLSVSFRGGRNLLSVGANEFGGLMTIGAKTDETVFSAFSTKTGGSMSLSNSGGGPVIIANINRSGDGHLETRDGNGVSSWDSSTSPLDGTLELVRTRSLTVVNERGRSAVSVSSDSSGNGTLIVSSDGGEAALSMFSTESGGALAVHSAEGNGVGILRANSAGSAALGIFSPQGGRLVTAEGTEDGHGLLVVTDADGQKVGIERGILAIKNDDDEIVLSAAAGRNGSGVLRVLSPSLRELVSAGADSVGNGILVIHNKGGEVSWRSDKATGPSTNLLLGDLDSDGDIDFADFLTFAQNFGKTIETGS